MAATTTLGRDTSCTTRLFAGRVVEGARLLAEAYFRRLTTERGALLDDPDYGLAVSGLLNAGLTVSELASIPGRIRNELEKDDRGKREALRVVVRRSTTNVAAYTIAIHGETQDGDGFDLVLSVDEVTVQILGVAA